MSRITHYRSFKGWCLNVEMYDFDDRNMSSYFITYLNLVTIFYAILEISVTNFCLSDCVDSDCDLFTLKA